MSHTEPEIIVYPVADALFDGAAQRFVTAANNFIADYGAFRIALSGGKTPQGLYERLAQPDFIAKIDWTRVQVFWGDERHVPPYHEDSNFRMARQTLLARTHLPSDHMHRILGELPNAQQGADDYERTLREAFQLTPDETPRFDLILLGLGPDGHIASLFPNSAGLDCDDRLVVAHHIDSIGADRISLTFRTINAAANVWFLVAGGGKAAIVHKVTAEQCQDDLPARRIAPTNGQLTWLLDADAASKLGGMKGVRRVD